jgi:predicted phosphohydrolase
MKRMCSMCREAKEESEFYYCKKLKAYNPYCRRCNSLYQREYKRIWRERKKEGEKMPEPIKDKLIIRNYTDLEDLEVISYVRTVISEGKISKSKQGEQYSFITTFKSGITISSTRRNNTHTFWIYKEKSHD